MFMMQLITSFDHQARFSSHVHSNLFSEEVNTRTKKYKNQEEIISYLYFPETVRKNGRSRYLFAVSMVAFFFVKETLLQNMRHFQQGYPNQFAPPLFKVCVRSVVNQPV